MRERPERGGVGWIGPSVVHRVALVLELELELELIQTRMAQKPLLWVEVGAHAVRKKSERDGGRGQVLVSRGAWVCVLFLMPLELPGIASFLCVVLPCRGLCAKHRLFMGWWFEGHGPLGRCRVMDCLLVFLHWRWYWWRR